MVTILFCILHSTSGTVMHYTLTLSEMKKVYYINKPEVPYKKEDKNPLDHEENSPDHVHIFRRIEHGS